MRKSRSIKFYCFSPPVMLATLTAESVLAVYTVWRYKLDEVTKLGVVTLITLATFQLAEYFVCTGYGLRAEQWSRLGFIAITALPPLGLHLMHKLAHKKVGKLVYAAYASMAAFMAFFVIYRYAFIGHQCTGNYVIFQLGQRVGGAYTIYYYAWLAVGITLGGIWANKLLENKGTQSRKRLETVRALILGYLVFLIPVALANTISPQTRRGIPSIMCGFAVIFALILSLYIMPRVGKQKVTFRNFRNA